LRRKEVGVSSYIYFNIKTLVEQFLTAFVYQSRIMEAQPILEISIRDLDVDGFSVLSNVGGGLEPGFEGLVFNPVFDRGQYPVPGI